MERTGVAHPPRLFSWGVLCSCVLLSGNEPLKSLTAFWHTKAEAGGKNFGPFNVFWAHSSSFLSSFFSQTRTEGFSVANLLLFFFFLPYNIGDERLIILVMCPKRTSHRKKPWMSWRQMCRRVKSAALRRLLVWTQLHLQHVRPSIPNVSTSVWHSWTWCRFPLLGKMSLITSAREKKKPFKQDPRS